MNLNCSVIINMHRNNLPCLLASDEIREYMHCHLLYIFLELIYILKHLGQAM